MMSILTIPKKLGEKDDLLVIPKKEYEELLKRLKRVESLDNRLWQRASKEKLLDFYDQTDAIYDKI